MNVEAIKSAPANVFANAKAIAAKPLVRECVRYGAITATVVGVYAAIVVVANHCMPA